MIRFGRDVESVELEKILSDLNGEIYNVPPKESAVKVQVRTRMIKSLNLIDYDFSARIAVIEIFCVAGTYIRTLTRDDYFYWIHLVRCLSYIETERVFLMKLWHAICIN